MKISKYDLLSISNRYIELYESTSNEYTNVRNNFSKLFLYSFFNNLKERINHINKSDIKRFIDELSFNLNRVNCGDYYDNFQDKLNGEIRASYLPPIYSLINYELIVEKTYKIINYIIINNHNFDFLIEGKFYTYAHQYIESKEGYVSKKSYIDLWKRYKDSHRKINKKSLRFVLSTDIKDFYENINIDSLINELNYFITNNISFKNLNEEIEFLEQFFGFIWDGKTDFEKTLDKFLYELFSKILKVNKNNYLGLPQNIIASDYLSNLYLFIKLHNNLKELELNIVKSNDGNYFFYKKDSTNELYFNNYSDDFTVITNDYIYGKKILNNLLIDFLSKDGLKINISKTNIVNYSDYLKNNYIDIDFKKIYLKDESEIIKYKKILMHNIKNQNLWKCKTLIKFFYINLEIKNLNEELLSMIIDIIKIDDLRNFGKKIKIALVI